MKLATVVISALPPGKNTREVEIRPGSTAADVLRTLNLDGYLLSREGSAQSFAAEEVIYDAIRDGDKLRATPIAEVGAGFWQAVLELFGVSDEPSKALVRTRPPRIDDGTTATSKLRNGRPVVEPDSRPLWQLRGWRAQGEKLVGAFRTPRGSYAGEISLANRHRPEFFIVNPPPTLLTGSHAACFRSRGGGRYFVHFGVAHPEPDAGIAAIEKLIVASLKATRS